MRGYGRSCLKLSNLIEDAEEAEERAAMEEEEEAEGDDADADGEVEERAAVRSSCDRAVPASRRALARAAASTLTTSWRYGTVR